MSMVQQLILAVANAERQIDGQIGQLTAYVTELDHVTGRVSSAAAKAQSRTFLSFMTVDLLGNKVITLL